MVHYVYETIILCVCVCVRSRAHTHVDARAWHHLLI